MTSQVLVTIATERHWLNGAVSLSGNRILDVMNADGSEFLQLHSAKLLRRDDTAAICLDTEIVIAKSSIQYLVIHSDRHEAPDKRALYATVAKKTANVIVISNGCEIRGQAYFSGPADPRRFLSGELGAFFPLKNAKIFDKENAHEHLEVPVVMLNRKQVSILIFESGTPSSSVDFVDEISQRISEILHTR